MDQLALGETACEVEGASYVRDGELLCAEHVGLHLQVGKSEKPSADALSEQLTHSQSIHCCQGSRRPICLALIHHVLSLGQSHLQFPKLPCASYCQGSSVDIPNAFLEGGGTELSQHTIQSSITVGIPTVYLATAATVMLLVAVVRLLLFSSMVYLLVLACERNNRANDPLDGT